MGGTTFSSSSGRLGGYLTEIQSPIQASYLLYYTLTTALYYIIFIMHNSTNQHLDR